MNFSELKNILPNWVRTESDWVPNPTCRFSAMLDTIQEELIKEGKLDEKTSHVIRVTSGSTLNKMRVDFIINRKDEIWLIRVMSSEKMSEGKKTNPFLTRDILGYLEANGIKVQRKVLVVDNFTRRLEEDEHYFTHNVYELVKNCKDSCKVFVSMQPNLNKV